MEVVDKAFTTSGGIDKTAHNLCAIGVCHAALICAFLLRLNRMKYTDPIEIINEEVSGTAKPLLPQRRVDITSVSQTELIVDVFQSQPCRILELLFSFIDQLLFE